jgi:mono/diheme cytochrome c family protein
MEKQQRFSNYTMEGDQMKQLVLMAACLIAAANTLADDTNTAQNAVAAAASGPVVSPADKPYGKVIDGYEVNPFVMEGFRTWRAAACDRCHGANQEGLVGPSLIDSLKSLSKEDFIKTLTEGRLDKGMPSWKTSNNVMDHIDNLYAYLKGRSDGVITKAHVQESK